MRISTRYVGVWFTIQDTANRKGLRLIFEKGIENEQIERSNKDNIWSFQTKVVKEIQFSTWVVNKSFQNEDNQTKRYCDFQAKQNLENQEVQATKSIG